MYMTEEEEDEHFYNRNICMIKKKKISAAVATIGLMMIIPQIVMLMCPKV